MRKRKDDSAGGKNGSGSGRKPPQNLEAEQSLLGAILISENVFDNIAPVVDTADFYDIKHKKIYEAMKELSRGDSAVDVVTVSEALRTSGGLDNSGGAAYLSALSDSVGTPAHAAEYAKIVREKSILRNLISISTRAIEESLTEEKEPRTILEGVEKNIFELAEQGQKGGVKAVKDLVAGVFDQITAMGDREEKLTGLPFGYSKIDDHTSGMQPSELVIIAARPSLGKTSLALNMSYELAVNKGKNVLIFSFEMNEQDLIKRLLAYGSRIQLYKIRTGKYISGSERPRLIDILGRLSDSSVMIDTEDNSVFDIRSKTRSLMASLARKNEKLDLVIVDYLQLVKPDDRIPREQQISQISRALKAIAREMKIPVVALSQLNREVDRERGEKKAGPKLSNLRESGALEQDADVVIFIDRETETEEKGIMSDEGGEKKVDIKKCKLLIAKNRNGPVGFQKVVFVPDYTAFQEIDEREMAGESEAAGYGDGF